MRRKNIRLRVSEGAAAWYIENLSAWTLSRTNLYRKYFSLDIISRAVKSLCDAGMTAPVSLSTCRYAAHKYVRPILPPYLPSDDNRVAVGLGGVHFFGGGAFAGLDHLDEAVK